MAPIVEGQAFDAGGHAGPLEGPCPHGAWEARILVFCSGLDEAPMLIIDQSLCPAARELGTVAPDPLDGVSQGLHAQAEPATMKTWESRARSSRMALAPKPSACRPRMKVAMSEPLMDARE